MKGRERVPTRGAAPSAPTISKASVSLLSAERTRRRGWTLHSVAHRGQEMAGINTALSLVGSHCWRCSGWTVVWLHSLQAGVTMLCLEMHPTVCGIDYLLMETMKHTLDTSFQPGELTTRSRFMAMLKKNMLPVTPFQGEKSSDAHFNIIRLPVSPSVYYQPSKWQMENNI